MTNASISSRQASELLDVHESSIKRWCNSGELSCWLTPGGHRRIPVTSLVDFAKDRDLDAPIIGFGAEAERVWIGVEASREGDHTILSRLLFEWLERERTDLIEQLIAFLLGEGLRPGEIFDGVLAGAMRRVGSDYQSREISIGDEHRMTQAARDALIGVRRLIESAEPEEDGQPVAVVGCARSEVHEMGALAIRLILRHHGWRVLYLGADVPTEEFHTQQVKNGASLICVSMSPVKGETTATEIAQLLGLLADRSHPFRLAIGGAGLDERDISVDNPAVVEARLFRSASRFEAWIEDLYPQSKEPATVAP